jgi:excisionase family DNA binding protein
MSDNIQKPLLLTPRDAAKLLAIGERTLWGLTQSGEIRAVRVGRLVRYSLTELEAWVARRTQQTGPLPFPGSDKAAV